MNLLINIGVWLESIYTYIFISVLTYRWALVENWDKDGSGWEWVSALFWPMAIFFLFMARIIKWANLLVGK